MAIYGNTVGGSRMPNVLTIETDDGVELEGVVVDTVQVLDATPNDVRAGKKFAGANGILTGEKDIPSYRTTQGRKLIAIGQSFSISSLITYDQYDYTQLQCIIAPYNSNISADKVVLNNGVFPVNSTTKISDVIKNHTNKTIDLNIGINNTNSIYSIYYFTYKEEG